jgi:hypothetical protein
MLGSVREDFVVEVIPELRKSPALPLVLQLLPSLHS